MFSVVFQHRISKCISCLFYALGTPRFVNISVSYYAPKLYTPVCLSQTGSNFLTQRVSQCNFLLLFNVPGALGSLFPFWFTPFYVWALKAARTQVWHSLKWLAMTSFSPQSPLLHSHIPFYFLANSDFALKLSFTDNLPRVASIHLSDLKIFTPSLTQEPQR